MHRHEIQTYAEEKFKEHNLSDWKLLFIDAYSKAGSCSYFEKTIKLSNQYIEIFPDNEIKDTILHEIAHALCGPKEGHGLLWKNTCLNIGARPKRCIPNELVTKLEKKWIAICPTCNNKFGKMKKPKRTDMFYCKKCKSLYPDDKSKYNLIFYKNTIFKQ